MKLYIGENLRMEQMRGAQLVCVHADGEGDYNAAVYNKSFPGFIDAYRVHRALVLQNEVVMRNHRYCFFTDNGTIRPFRYVIMDRVLYHLFVGKTNRNDSDAELSKSYLDDLYQSMVEVRDYMRAFNEKKLWILWKDSGLSDFCLNDVKIIIENVFGTTNMEIHIGQIEIG